MSAFRTNTVFDMEVLKNGNEQEINQQVDLWTTSDKPSVYVQWVPDELDQNEATRFFSSFGSVDRVEFVPKKDANGKKIGRMMFVQFQTFNHSKDFAQNIAILHPEPYEIGWHTRNKFGAPKQYVLKCRINTRPIPKVEYSASQLTDMFEGLNKRLVEQMAKMTEQMTLMAKEIEHLRNVSYANDINHK